MKPKYRVGQKVRIKKNLTDNKLLKTVWEGAICEIITVAYSTMFEEFFYTLTNCSGLVDVFRETELDLRFRKNPHPLEGVTIVGYEKTLGIELL